MTNSESASQSHDVLTKDSSKADIDTAPKDSSPHDKSDEARHDAAEVDVSPSAFPPYAGLSETFVNNDLKDASSVDEGDARQELTREETATEPEQVIVETADIAQREQHETNQKKSFSPSKTSAQLQDVNVEKKEPAVGKQAVQDPGLDDITDLPPESNIIDVDTFDDVDDEDVSEDDAAQSPTAEESVSEAEDLDHLKTVDTSEVLAPYSQSEAIDLTESPSTKPKESPKQEDGRDFAIIDKSAAEPDEQAGQAEPITGMPVDDDEAPETAGGTTGKGANQDFETQDDTVSLTKSDGHLDESTPDTDTVSADVNIDMNGDESPPQQIPTGDDSASPSAKEGVDIDYSGDEAGHIESDGDQLMTTAKSDDAGGDENEQNGTRGKTKSKVIPADIPGVDVRDSENRNKEPGTTEVELENSNLDNGISTMPILENKGTDNGATVIPADDKLGPRAGETLPGSNDGLQAEEPQGKNLHSVSQSGHFARYHKNSESAIRSNVTGDVMTAPNGENQSPFDQIMSEDDAASEQFDRSPKVLDEKANVGPVAALISRSVQERSPVSIEPHLQASRFVENTDQGKPVEPDAETSVDVTRTRGPVPNETAEPTERHLASGSESLKLGEDKQREQTDNSKTDLDISITGPEDDSQGKGAAGRGVFFNVKASSDRPVPKFESKDDEKRTNEGEHIHTDPNLKVSGVKGKAAESDADKLSEQGKSKGTGHQAPLFGIQLSMPMKTGPLSFSSPPTFPRYSMNPQAVPFFPSKRNNGDGSPEKSKTIVEPFAITPDAVNREQISGAKASQETATATEEKKTLVGSATREYKKDKAEGLLAKEIPTPQVHDNALQSGAHPTQTIVPADKTSKEEVSTDREFESGLALESEPSLKKLAPKKVSFAPTPVKGVTTLRKPDKEQSMQLITAEKTAQGAKTGDSTSKLDGHASVVDASSESKEIARLGKTPKDTDAVKEKQRIVQVQTDEGLRREVANVTVAIRQDNSKMKLDRKKLTIQLTTGAKGSGKLQFFKGSGSSLKLYASLESKKDYLRVRKVTNRQYCMSVAKMAPPGDDAADIVEKYFVHFDERDIFEEMYSQSVANLQRQQKSIPHITEPDRSKRAVQTPVEESTNVQNRQSTTKTGVKRSAENDNATQVNKKSKLLADKKKLLNKKLLDKMAALQRKKGQKGGPASEGKQTQPIVAHSERTRVPLADSGTRKSAQQTDKKVEPRSENAERNLNEPLTSATKGTHSSKRGATEKASKENVTKRARMASSHSTVHESKIVTTRKSGAEPNLGQSASANACNASKDEVIQGGSTEAKTSPTTLPKSSKGLHIVGREQSGTLTDTKLPNVDANRPEHPDDGALLKVKEDFKQAQKEKDVLQQELAARNHSLSIERAKTSQVQREHSHEWQRIRSLVEVLGDEMGRLRRDEADRSMESLKRCEPSSSVDFFDRLHSFRPSTWAAFENCEIGALECALKGWHNSGPNTIRSSEGSEITLGPSYDDLNLRQSEVERVRSLLREGHSLLSGWIGHACPEAFRTFAGSQRMLTKENLRANTETLRDQRFDGKDLRFDWGANALLLSDDVCERLAVYNWSMDGECLRCTWCNRRVTVNGGSRFNATSRHYAFCPFRSETWKDSVLCNARTLGIEGGGDVVMRE